MNPQRTARGINMGQFLIVSRVEHLEEYRQLAEKYQVAYEINDFYNPAVLDDEERRQRIISQYQTAGFPENSTMHGAFLDVVLFSQDARIQDISRLRMEQSMQIARQLRVKGVVFHTNINPMLSSPEYDRRAIDMTAAYLKELLERYPDVHIYLENMFDATPDILVQISERLKGFGNYGVCFDYAHAIIYGFPIAVWIKQLAPYVRHIHINDNDLKHDFHLALGAGKIEWKQFFTYYNTYFHDCSVLIETTQPEAQRESLEYLSEMGDRYGE